MATFKEEIAALKAKEDTLTRNKVANFAYEDAAYQEDNADGVTMYEYNNTQNIPVGTADILQTNPTVLAKGYRSQASSLSRMLMNHFFGRVSYNLNKINDIMSSLLDKINNALGTPDGIATLGSDGKVADEQLKLAVPDGIATLDSEGKVVTEQLPLKEDLTDASQDTIPTTQNLLDEVNREVAARNTAITNAVNALDVDAVGGGGKYIRSISQKDGKIFPVEAPLQKVIGGTATNDVDIPTTKAVSDYVTEVVTNGTTSIAQWTLTYPIDTNYYPLCRITQDTGGAIVLVEMSKEAFTGTLIAQLAWANRTLSSMNTEPSSFNVMSNVNTSASMQYLGLSWVNASEGLFCVRNDYKYNNNSTQVEYKVTVFAKDAATLKPTDLTAKTVQYAYNTYRGNQNIFAAPPMVNQTPVRNNELANKAYVDSRRAVDLGMQGSSYQNLTPYLAFGSSSETEAAFLLGDNVNLLIAHTCLAQTSYDNKFNVYSLDSPVAVKNISVGLAPALDYIQLNSFRISINTTIFSISSLIHDDANWATSGEFYASNSSTPGSIFALIPVNGNSCAACYAQGVYIYNASTTPTKVSSLVANCCCSSYDGQVVALGSSCAYGRYNSSSFTNVALPNGFTAKDVTYGNDCFLAIGNQDSKTKLCYSFSGGASWTLIDPPTQDVVEASVAFCDGLFALVDANGKVYVSASPTQNWTIFAVANYGGAVRCIRSYQGWFLIQRGFQVFKFRPRLCIKYQSETIKL